MRTILMCLIAVGALACTTVKEKNGPPMPTPEKAMPMEPAPGGETPKPPTPEMTPPTTP